MSGAVGVERRLRTRIRGSLSDWAKLALAPQGLVPARHHGAVISELEGLVAGRFDRLMLLLPPGSAKSTYASLLLPPWFLAREPGAHVIAASHTASLALSFGRGVRGLITEHKARLGIAMDPASRAAGRFGLLSGGSYFATGVRGPLTGRRADLVIVDDPVKGQREADSAAAREHLWEWFRSDLVTRLRPGGRIAVVMTRWHPDDLGGRLLSGEDGWRVLRLPALAEEGDPLGRTMGEALWPKWESAAALRRKRTALGERAFAALFQQSPRVPGRAAVPGKAGRGDGRGDGGDQRAGVGPGCERAWGRLDGGGPALPGGGGDLPSGRCRAAAGGAGGGCAGDPGGGRGGWAGCGDRVAAGSGAGGSGAGFVPDGAAGGVAGVEQPGERGEGDAGDAGCEPGECGELELAAG